MKSNTETLIRNEIKRLKKLYPDLNHIKLDLIKDHIEQVVKAEIRAVYKGVQICESAIHRTPLYAFVDSFLKVKFYLDRQHF